MRDVTKLPHPAAFTQLGHCRRSNMIVVHCTRRKEFSTGREHNDSNASDTYIHKAPSFRTHDFSLSPTGGRRTEKRKAKYKTDKIHKDKEEKRTKSRRSAQTYIVPSSPPPHVTWKQETRSKEWENRNLTEHKKRTFLITHLFVPRCPHHPSHARSSLSLSRITQQVIPSFHTTTHARVEYARYARVGQSNPATPGTKRATNEVK